MKKITGRHLLCFFLLALPLSWAEDTKKDARKSENNTGARMVCNPILQNIHYNKMLIDSEEYIQIKLRGELAHRNEYRYQEVWSQTRTRRLFARRKISLPQESQTPKNKSNPMTPARRCGRLMESCSNYVPCCDPCATCRCRLFNTICHCWRMNPLCLKKT